MRHAYESFRVAATGRWAVSVRIYVLTVPFAFLMNIERENLLNPGNASRSIAICVAGELASYLYIFIAQATLLKNRRVRLQRLSKCMFVWFSTGIVKGTFFIVYAVLAFGYEPDIAMRMILPTLFTGISSGVLAFYFGTIDRKRIESNALTSLNSLLSEEEEQLFSSAKRSKLELVQALKENLAPKTAKLQSLTSDLFENHAPSQSVFPSQELLIISNEIDELMKSKIEKFQLNQNMLLIGEKIELEAPFLLGLEPKVISVRVTIIAILLGMSAGQLTRNGLAGLASGILGAGILGIVLTVLRLISKELTDIKAKALIIASYPIVFLTQYTYVYNLSRMGFDLAHPYPPWYSAMKTIYGYYIASIVAGLIIQNSQKLMKSKDVHGKVQSNISIMTRENLLLSQHIFDIRFGVIQGKLSGVILALQLTSKTSVGDSSRLNQKGVIDDARKLLSEAMEEIELLSLEIVDV